MAWGLGNIDDKTCIIGAALYSCGLGQVLGVPGTIISLAVGIIQKIGAWLASGSDHRDQARAARLNESAAFSFKMAGTFALGMIPVGGGIAAYYLLWRNAPDSTETAS